MSTIKPRYTPRDAYFDDPADKIDGEDSSENDSKRTGSLVRDVLARVFEWLTRKGSVTHRALRSDVVILHVTPHNLPCKRPSAAWLAQKHGVSRQRVSELGRDFASSLGPRIQFRGQRFLNRRRGRGRQGERGPQPGPVAVA